MTSAAIYARVSSAGRREDETIGSQTAALRDLPGSWGQAAGKNGCSRTSGHSGATPVRPALERLREVALAGVGVDVVLCYSPYRLARKFAYQALLIEELARAGTLELPPRPAREQPRRPADGAVPGHVRRV